MSDSESEKKKTALPFWQRKSQPEQENSESAKEEEPESREKIVSQAKQFLEEDEVRDASTDKKIAFLESKGLQESEIQELLGVTKNKEASAATPQPSPAAKTTIPPPPPPPQPQTQTFQAPSQPPIITYPEFLVAPQNQQAPLITTSRVLTTLTLFSTLTLLLHGTSAYLVKPMLQTLTESRLSLSDTTSQNLAKLIEKLESVVSEIPPTISQKAHTEIDEESDSDPTEMFHRDIGVQTSPPRSENGIIDDEKPLGSLESQVTRLSGLTSSLRELDEASAAEGHSSSELEGTMGVFKEYLDSMAFVPASNYGYASGGFYGGGYGNRNGEPEDEIDRVKKGIRGVKGVLLSARSFPGGGGAVGGVR